MKSSNRDSSITGMAVSGSQEFDPERAVGKNRKHDLSRIIKSLTRKYKY